MEYAVHNVPSYQHLKGTEKRAHEGSQSQGHMAGGSAGYTTGLSEGKPHSAPEHNPGGYTQSKVGSGGKHNLGM